MRNRGYVKRGSGIDVQIRDEYFVTAYIMPLNDVKPEFGYVLSIRNTETGISVELDKTFIILSTFKTVNKDVTTRLNSMIDEGYFDEGVEDINNMLKCLNALLELQKKLKNENGEN